MRKRLVLSMVGLVLAVVLAHDIPLARHLSQIEQDRTVTAIERDAFTFGARLSPILGAYTQNPQAQIGAVLDEYAQIADGVVVVIVVTESLGIGVAITLASFVARCISSYWWTSLKHLVGASAYDLSLQVSDSLALVFFNSHFHRLAASKAPERDSK